eukprot:38273-Amphidinium_carterae.1
MAAAEADPSQALEAEPSAAWLAASCAACVSKAGRPNSNSLTSSKVESKRLGDPPSTTVGAPLGVFA